MPTTTEVRSWGDEVTSAAARIAGRFARREQRACRRVFAWIDRSRGCKNGWQLAEQLGAATPTNLQHFLARAEWSADAVRDDLRSYVVEHLGDPDGVLIVDETGFLKKGTKSVGVKRQYSGTAGRIENCQVGVFLAYRSQRGHALVDRALYLPREWADDASRRAEAKVPESIAFATKQTLARAMIERALNAEVACAWLTADEAYGSDYKFRRFCEEKRLNYVIAISSATHLYLAGKRRAVGKHLVDVPAQAWRRLSCGKGAKGEREYDWAFVAWPHYEQDSHARGWLIRRSTDATPEHAFYFTYAPRETPLVKLVEVAGSRWAVEECFQQAKQETGLDEYEVRSWIGWHRHVTLAMLAHAALVVLRARCADDATYAASKKKPNSSRSPSPKSAR
ncbi:MAG: IS701 family transposase [Pirellulales bacterium]